MHAQSSTASLSKAAARTTRCRAHRLGEPTQTTRTRTAQSTTAIALCASLEGVGSFTGASYVEPACKAADWPSIRFTPLSKKASLSPPLSKHFQLLSPSPRELWSAKRKGEGGRGVAEFAVPAACSRIRPARSADCSLGAGGLSTRQGRRVGAPPRMVALKQELRPPHAGSLWACSADRLADA